MNSINQYKDFTIILYTEPSIDLILLLGGSDYAYIKHDKDIYEQDNEKKGQIKKTHYHLYVRLRKKKTIGGVYEIINKWCANSTQTHLIQECNNIPLTIRYLTHADDIDKYQYSILDIKTNMTLDYYFNIILTDATFTLNVINMIYNSEFKSFKDLTHYAMLQGKLELIMRRAYFFKILLDA